MANLEFCDTHNMVAYLHKTEGSEGFHQIVDFLNTSHIKYALTKNPTIHVSLIQQFWQTAAANTLDSREVQITATIDGKVKLVSEASIRRHLKLEDSDGITTLPNTEIFEQLTLMGYVSNSDKLTFQKGHFSPQWRFLIHTILHCLSPKKTAWEQFSSNIATAIICLATNMDSPNLQGQGLTVQSDSHHTTTSGPSTSPPYMQTTHVVEETATLPHDSPLPRVHSLGSDEGSMTLHELTVLYTTLSKKVESFESDLKQTKLTYGVAFTKLIVKVKMLKKEVKLNKAKRRAKIVVSDDEDAEKDTSKQGRSLIRDIDQIQGFLVHMMLRIRGAKILAYVARVHTYSRRRRTVSTGSGGISTNEESVSTVGASMPVSTAGMDQGSIPLPSASKDKRKAIMTESKPEQATTKLKQRLEIAGYEAAIRLQEQLDEEESQRIAKDADGFTDAEWDDILARVAADEDLVQQLQAGEKYSEEDLPMKLVELVNQRKKFFVKKFLKIAKRQKIEEASGSGEEQSAKKEKVLSEEELQKLMMIVPVEEVYVKALQKLIDFDDMLKKFDRVDLDNLWSLVKERFSSIAPTDDKERILWVELKRLFKPDIDDILWKLQRYMHDPLTWRLI
ncbi:hypothetical protein Tco_0355909 [Tanacetum coccineum]